MRDLYNEFNELWTGVDPLHAPPSPARDLTFAERFEGEMTNGGIAQFLWNYFPRWEETLDGAEMIVGFFQHLLGGLPHFFFQPKGGKGFGAVHCG